MPLADGDTTGHTELDVFLKAFIAWVESDSAVPCQPTRTWDLRQATIAAYRDMRQTDGWAQVVSDIEVSLPLPADAITNPLSFLAACAVGWAAEVCERDGRESTHAQWHYLTCFYAAAIEHCPAIRASW